MGDKEQESKWRIEYLSIKDTLLNYQQIASVNEVRFLAEMKKVDEQMSHEAQKRRTITYSLITVLGLAILITVFLVVVYKKNKLLAKRNRSLYNNNVEMLKKEEEERKRRQQMEQTIALLKENKEQTNSHTTIEDTPSKPTENRTEKYKNSNLTDEQKQQLLNDIREVMESNPKIFDLNFTQEQLAELVHSKSKYVSQVINELCQCNFSAFVNEYRVKEACQRINDIEHYGKLTIEAVSMSVGFKSRSTFNSAFRKFTGLTPGEYLRIAREKQ